jgi:hypothetical protein
MLFRAIHDVALMMDRERAAREASPSVGVIDSQTVKAPAPGAKRGYDAAKKTVGRKRHVTVDTRRSPLDGQSHDGRHLRQRWGADDPLILDAITRRPII